MAFIDNFNTLYDYFSNIKVVKHLIKNENFVELVEHMNENSFEDVISKSITMFIGSLLEKNIFLHDIIKNYINKIILLPDIDSKLKSFYTDLVNPFSTKIDISLDKFISIYKSNPSVISKINNAKCYKIFLYMILYHFIFYQLSLKNNESDDIKNINEIITNISNLYSSDEFLGTTIPVKRKRDTMLIYSDDDSDNVEKNEDSKE
jgi:flagellin-specific chaperone FliS